MVHCTCRRLWTLLWRRNECNGVSNHQPHDCLLNRLFRRRSKKTSKLCITGLCAGNSPATSEFTAQRASNAENASIWWRHHEPTCGSLPVSALAASRLPHTFTPYSIMALSAGVNIHLMCNHKGLLDFSQVILRLWIDDQRIFNTIFWIRCQYLSPMEVGSQSY